MKDGRLVVEMSLESILMSPHGTRRRIETRLTGIELSHQSEIDGWLSGVAKKVARCARRDTARRESRRKRFAEQLDPTRLIDDSGAFDESVAAVLKEEVNRLPEKLRVPFGELVRIVSTVQPWLAAVTT